MQKPPRFFRRPLEFDHVLASVTVCLWCAVLLMRVSPRILYNFAAVGLLLPVLLLWGQPLSHALSSRIFRRRRTALLLCLTVLCAWAFQLLVFQQLARCNIFPDSPSYLDYSRHLLRGEVDASRTPGYPWFIQLAMWLAGGNLMGVVWLQDALYLAAVAVCFLTLRHWVRDIAWAAGAALVYGLQPALFCWNVCVLTEALAISGVMLWLCAWLGYLRRPRILSAVGLSIGALALMMVRPGFLVLLALLAVFWLLRALLCRGEWRQNLAGILSVIACVGLLQGYVALNKAANDIPEISDVPLGINQLWLLIDAGAVENSAEPEMFLAIWHAKNEGLDTGATLDRLADTYPMARRVAFAKQALRENLGVYTRYLLRRVPALLSEPAATLYSEVVPGIEPTMRIIVYWLMALCFPVSIGGLVLLATGGIGHALWAWLRRGTLDWAEAGLSVLGLGQIVAALLGAQGEYARLVAPALPFMLLLAWYWLARARQQISLFPSAKPLPPSIPA